MPLHLCPSSRRRFLGQLGAAVVTLPALRLSAAGAGIDNDLVVFLNDTHIGEKHSPTAPVRQHLVTTVEAILALEKRPAAVFINGDLALRDGLPGDYRLFLELIQPLRAAGIPLHLTLGNHDNRDTFYEICASEKPARPLVASRHVSVVRTARANFFLVDSLLKTMVGEGELGSAQLRWLAQALDADRAKPAIVMGHHNPRLGGDPAHYRLALIDSEPLWAVLGPRRHVKAYVHGHVHMWSRAAHAGIHIINTPATSSVGNPAEATPGWSLVRLRNNGLTLTTCTYLTEHPWHNRSHDFAWRT